jgi:hypothetical protein
MVEDEQGVVRAVAWCEVLPWLRIYRTFRLAVSVRVLLLAAVATAITLGGWALIGRVFSGDRQEAGLLDDAAQWPWVFVHRLVPNELPFTERPAAQGAAEAASPSDQLGQVAAASPADHVGFFGAWWRLLRPFWLALDLQRGPKELAYLLLAGLWSLATWAFFGGAITRIAAVELSCEERVGLMPALRYACGKWRAYFAAPLFPVLAIAGLALLVFLPSLLLRYEWGLLVVAITWPIGLLFGLIMTVLVLWAVFGWPLMFPTISTEGTDSFDAVSRSYSYLFQRPLHYLFYALMAAVLGTLGWLLVSNFAAGVIGMSNWAASWACGAPRIEEIIGGGNNLDQVGSAGAAVLGFWTGCVKLLAVGFLYGFFFTAATAIYLLLRRDVDDTELDEVFLDEDQSEEEYGLPPLVTDAAGAPMATDNVPEVEPERE